MLSIFDKWQLLKHPKGYELIALDFVNMNLSKINLDYNMWFHFFTIIKQNTTVNRKDKNIDVMLQQIQKEDEEVNKGKNIEI